MSTELVKYCEHYKEFNVQRIPLNTAVQSRLLSLDGAGYVLVQPLVHPGSSIHSYIRAPPSTRTSGLLHPLVHPGSSSHSYIRVPPSTRTSGLLHPLVHPGSSIHSYIRAPPPTRTSGLLHPLVHPGSSIHSYIRAPPSTRTSGLLHPLVIRVFLARVIERCLKNKRKRGICKIISKLCCLKKTLTTFRLTFYRSFIFTISSECN